MPEGDTIYRVARTLHRALAGHPVVRFESVLPALMRVHDDRPLTQTTIEQVVAAGKHLLMHFSSGLVLRTHMRMNGSWHLYRPGERWQRARSDMRVLIVTPEFEAVGFSIPVAEFIRSGDLRRHSTLARLGPDVLGDTFDAADAIRRLRARPSSRIGEALLDQRAIAGLGNVYKSEVLFAGGINPFVTVDRLDDRQLSHLIEVARTLIRANVVERRSRAASYGALRRTTGRDDPRENLWVYGRGRRPCRRCGTPISVRRHGIDARLTYWCTACQRSPDE